MPTTILEDIEPLESWYVAAAGEANKGACTKRTVPKAAAKIFFMPLRRPRGARG
jgi:hypothetical protein